MTCSTSPLVDQSRLIGDLEIASQKLHSNAPADAIHQALLNDTMNWLLEDSRSPDFVLREKSSSTISYAATIARSLTNGQDFIDASKNCTLPMRHNFSATEGIDYQIRMPATLDSQKAYPLVIDLPGLGWTQRPLGFHRGARQNPFSQIFVVMPINDLPWSWDIRKLEGLLTHLQESLPIDKDRVFLMGHSLGGNGVWEWAKRHPDHFAGISPWSAWTENKGLEKLVAIPTLVIHGANDPIINPDWNLLPAKRLSKIGGRVTYDILNKEGHYLPQPYTYHRTILWFLEIVAPENRIQISHAPNESTFPSPPKRS